MLNIKTVFVYTLCVIVLFGLAACGIRGNPKAPIPRDIPKIVDLTGIQTGASVKLSWKPSFNYTDGAELQLRGVEIYRLEENVIPLIEKQEEIERYRQKFLGVRKDTENKEDFVLSPLASRATKVSGLPVRQFKSESRLAATVPVEQLLSLSSKGKVHWSESLSVDMESIPDNRVVYAIREVDIRGRKSDFSNTVSLLPMHIPPAPEDLLSNLTQQSLTLNWTYPRRHEPALQEIALLGFNLYKSVEDEAFAASPDNDVPIPTGPPLNWLPAGVISHQRIEGSTGRYAYLFTTSNEAIAAGVSQILLRGAEIGTRAGLPVVVTVNIKSVGGSSSGRIVLDASSDPGSTTPQEKQEILSERDDPLLNIEEILITGEPQTYRIAWNIPVDAKGLVLKIEPRKDLPLSATFVIESVSASIGGGTENIVENGDFAGFAPARYVEPITAFGPTFRYRLTAVYSVYGFTVESEPTDTITVAIRDTFQPDSPRALQVQGTFDSIVVSWAAALATDVRGYLVYRREGADGQWIKLTKEPIRATVYRDSKAEKGVLYYYRVESIDDSGNRSVPTPEAAARISN